MVYADGCFDAVGWAAGRASGLQKTEWWDVGVVIWDEVQTVISLS